MTTAKLWIGKADNIARSNSSGASFKIKENLANMMRLQTREICDQIINIALHDNDKSGNIDDAHLKSMICDLKLNLNQTNSKTALKNVGEFVLEENINCYSQK